MIESPVNPGEVLEGKYQVERTLGQGGMGVVVAALHLELGRTVAIKFLVRDAPANALERFMREAKAAALVKSEHVCRVHDFGRLASGEPYLVMEYLEGCDLADKLEAEGPQPIADVLGWIIQACDALSSAHAQGIVHRDLKPANLFLQQGTDGPTLKVLDFGISKLAASGALTSTAVLMGSPFYMSPEQLESSRDVDLRSDVWSLGVVLYELLTGIPPFAGETLVQIVVQAREHEPARMNTLRPEIPLEIERVVARCLSKNAAHRYQNVNDLVVDLAPFAPPDLSAIVTKLVKRAGRTSDPALALSKTMPSDPVILARASQKTRRDTPNARESEDGAPGTKPTEATEGRTFADLDTLSPRERARRARMALLGTACGVLAIFVVGFLVTRKPAAVPRLTQETTLSSSVAMASPASASSSLVAPDPSPPPRPSLAAPPIVAPPSARPAGHPTARPPQVASSPRPSALPVPASAAPASSGPKRRDVDRDYEP